MKEQMDFDALVVGAGPNGLAAAITLRSAGLSVLLLEANKKTGGGMRTAELTLPGFHHDICSAIHPMAVNSPFFKTLPLQDFGLEWIEAPISAAHPFDDGTVALLTKSIEETAFSLGEDRKTYKELFTRLSLDWSAIEQDVLAPLHFPNAPLPFARFGSKALKPANIFVKHFKTKQARGLWGGLAAHSVLPFGHLTSTAVGLVLAIAAHRAGWPMARGGSQSIANALTSYYLSIGGKLETGFEVRSLHQLPSSKALLFDLGPRQLLEIAGHKFSPFYKAQLRHYRYGMGVFKIDWALDDQIPFISEECLRAGTIHLGNGFEEIAASEKSTWIGLHSTKPFVILAQQSVFDASRVPGGKHTAWAYCHVPNGSTTDMTNVIERQVERFAPGFRDCIIGRHTFNTAELEHYNANYVGGDIIGGSRDIRQLFTRPSLRRSPYRTSAKGIYICSASTPPGGGVHGMCGHLAAKRVLKDMFSQ